MNRVAIEVRAAEGGDHAKDIVPRLARVFVRFCESNRL